MNYSKKEKIVNIVLSIFESIPTILTHPTHLPHNTFAFDINPTRIATNNKWPPPSPGTNYLQYYKLPKRQKIRQDFNVFVRSCSSIDWLNCNPKHRYRILWFSSLNHPWWNVKQIVEISREGNRSDRLKHKKKIIYMFFYWCLQSPRPVQTLSPDQS